MLLKYFDTWFTIFVYDKRGHLDKLVKASRVMRSFVLYLQMIYRFFITTSGCPTKVKTFNHALECVTWLWNLEFSKLFWYIFQYWDFFNDNFLFSGCKPGEWPIIYLALLLHTVLEFILESCNWKDKYTPGNL